MRRYNIKVREIKETEFELNAKNKKEAKLLVEEIVFKSKILDLSCVYHTSRYEYLINKNVRRNK